MVNHAYYRDLASKADKREKDRVRIREKRAEASGYDGPVTGEDCSYCGAAATGIDHIIPTSRGGPNTAENTTPACHRCNSSKRDRDLVDFLNDSTTEIDQERVLNNPKLTRFAHIIPGSSRFVATRRDQSRMSPMQKQKQDANTSKDIGQQADRNRVKCRFEEFWQAYPRKVKKKQAADLWKRKKLDRIADPIITDVVARSKRDPQWQEATKLIPHPTSYLNAERWTDEWDEPQTMEDAWAKACRVAKDRGIEPFKGAPHETPEQFMARVGA